MRSRLRGRADTVVVLDFETTGMSPDCGDRPIEVGAVCLEAGRTVGRFQSLMNPGRRISGFIERYTGITNGMLRTAPSCAVVMAELADFIADRDLVAHNASFDQRFLNAELQRIQRRHAGGFACSMLTARRVYPEAPEHKLGTLVRYNGLRAGGTFHRALADAEMTALLWLGMLDDIAAQHRVRRIPFDFMQELMRVPKQAAPAFLQQWGDAQVTQFR